MVTRSIHDYPKLFSLQYLRRFDLELNAPDEDGNHIYSRQVLTDGGTVQDPIHLYYSYSPRLRVGGVGPFMVHSLVQSIPSP